MVSGISFQNCCAKFGQNVQKKQLGEQGQAPTEFLNKLKDAGIPSDVIAKGKEAVETFAKSNKIALPTPPEPPKVGKTDGEAVAGAKSQGAVHANQNSALHRTTSDALKAVMEQNNIQSSGILKDDIATIKATIKGLDADAAKLLKEKLGLAGLSPDKVDDKEAAKKAFEGQSQVGDLNKHFLLNKVSKKPATTLS